MGPLSSVSWGWGGNATSSNGTTLDADSLHPSDSGACAGYTNADGQRRLPDLDGLDSDHVRERMAATTVSVSGGGN